MKRIVRTYTPIVLTAVALTLQLFSQVTGRWLVISARREGVFVAIEAILGVLAVFVCVGFVNNGVLELRAPGEFLHDINALGRKARLFEALQAAEKGLLESKDLFERDLEQAKKNTSIVLNAVYANARRALKNSRRRSLDQLGLSVGCLVVLLALAAFFGSAHYGGTNAFQHLSVSDGLGRHFYFVVVTMVTIGYGDVVPGNAFGYGFVVACACFTLFLLTFGVSFIVSHWYYSVARLEDDIRNELAQIARRLSVPTILVYIWR